MAANSNFICFVVDRCDMPLGIEDKRVHDKMMRASSYTSYYCRPASGRLNGRRYGRYGGAWCAKRRDKRQWLQVDFGALTKVSRIATQGRQNSAQWVKSYSLSYSKNGYAYVPYRVGGRTKVSQRTFQEFIISTSYSMLVFLLFYVPTAIFQKLVVQARVSANPGLKVKLGFDLSRLESHITTNIL